MVIKGNTTSAYFGVSMDAASNIISYSVVNKSGATNVVSVGVVYGSTAIEIFRKSFNSNESFQYLGEKIIIEKNYGVYIVCSGSTDFYFSIE